VKTSSPCSCGSRMFPFLRVVVGGRAFLACKLCATWSLFQIPGVWERMATPEEGK
jgi:hypothetical protein